MAIEKRITDTYKPIDKQVEAHECLARYIFYGGAMRGGKSVWLVMELLALLLEYPGNVGLLSRWELSSLKRTTMVKLWEFWPSEAIKRHHKADGVIELHNSSILYYMGLKPSSTSNALERLKSLELGCFAIDEETEVEKQYFDLLKTRLSLRLPDRTFPRYRGLGAGNPEPNWVAETFIEQDLPDHAFIQALPEDNPHIPPGYITQQEQDLPDELYQQYIKGSWDILMTQGQYVFPYSAIKAAMERTLEPKSPREGGVDIARFGGDSNVMALRAGPVVDLIYESKYQDTNKTTEDLEQILDDEEPDNTKIDSVGVGAGVYDNLKAKGYDVREIIGGSRPRDTERFINSRAENHWGFRKRLTDGDVDLPDESKLRAQFAGIKYKVATDRKVKIESKEDMKKRGFKSPDYAEAIINAYSEGSGARSKVWFM